MDGFLPPSSTVTRQLENGPLGTYFKRLFQETDSISILPKPEFFPGALARK
jgi:hypothetical protein